MPQQIDNNDIFKMMDLYFNNEYKLYEYVYNSFNHFMDETLKRILIESPNIFSERFDENKLIRYRFEFSNVKIRPPTIEQENRYMFPNDARDLNVTYNAKVTATVSQIQEIIDTMTDKIEEKKLIGKTENDVPITNIPIMVRSKYCTLNEKKGYDDKECKYDPGCHFIVKGNEKVVISLERMCENKPFVSIKKDGTGLIYAVQITSKSYENIGFSQIVSIKMKKDNTMLAKIPIFNDIPALVLFKVLGVETDHDILNTILYDETDIEMANLIRLSLENLVNDKNKPIINSKDAKEYLISKLKVVSKIKYTETDKGIKQQQREMHLMNLLDNNFLPHISKGRLHKAYFLGFMINKLLQTCLGRRPPDDRDSFINKRIDLVGNLIEELFRQYYKKMLHECSKFFKKRNDSDEKPINIIGQIKPNIIEQGLTAALSTGQWIKKRGVAQVLQRLTYLQSISFHRRVDAPSVDATTNKLTGPRHYHTSAAGFLCLTGDTEILLSNGKLKQIKDICKKDKVVSVDIDTMTNEDTGIKNIIKIMPNKVLKITTINGREIKCSEDHPFLVKRNNVLEYVKAIDLNNNDLVTIKHTIHNVDDKNYKKEVVIKSSDIKSEKYKKEMEHLLDKPLSIEQLEITARLIGSNITDGNICKSSLNSYNARFYLGELQDTKDMIADIIKLGFRKPNISRNTTNCKGIEQTTYQVALSGSFAQYLIIMGAFIGKKTEQIRKVPDWILNSTLSVKREFLSGFQGGDGARISVCNTQNRMRTVVGPTRQACRQDLWDHTVKYLEQISQIFFEFGIKNRVLKEFVKADKTYAVKIKIDEDPCNLERYCNTITYRYCNEKRRVSIAPIEYIKYKAYETKLKNNFYKEMQKLKDQGFKLKDIAKQLNIDFADVYDWSCNHEHSKNNGRRIIKNMINYDNFTNNVIEDKIYVPIKKIEEIDPEYVYDFETKNNNHNFISSSFVTHNCCLTGDTLITMSDYTKKRIDSLSINDKVITYNINSHKFESSGIYNYFSKAESEIYELYTNTNRYSLVLKCSGDHPIYNYTTKTYVQAKDIQLPFITLWHSNKITSSLEISEIYVNKGEIVYDFTTYSNNHNFIANDIVVSNCVETPEHAKVGLTKHLSLVAAITIVQLAQIPVLRAILLKNTNDITSVPITTLGAYTKVFLNGEWLGITDKPIKLEQKLRDMKRNNKISNTVGIAHNIRDREMKVYCDGGRLYRPVLCVENNEIVLSKKDIAKIGLDMSQKDKITDWDQFMIQLPGRIEYIDMEEAELAMISFKPTLVSKMHKRMLIEPPKIKDNLEIENRYDDSTYINYQYCDVHPSFLLSTIATNIPFCNHNQGPRNIFQYAQGKQAMGIYATNFRHRLDKSFVLYHPMKPLITTRTNKYTSIDQLPCGENCVVAIASYTGFNQEDSIIFNQSAIDRGLFRSVTLKKYQAQIQKNQVTSQDDVFLKPDPDKVAGMKHGSYDKLDDSGNVPEEHEVKDGDIIIGKVTPIQAVGNSTKVFRDSSTIYKDTDPGIVDRIWSGITNAEGYEMRKMRIRSERTPNVGELFA